MAAILIRVLTSLASLAGFAVNQTVQWVKHETLRLARMVRALGVWAGSYVSAHVVLVAAAIAVWEAFAIFLTHNVIVPLTSGTIARFIPPGSRGDGFVWILWDTGLNLKRAYEVLLLYLANYTALWRAFALWMRSLNLSIMTYRKALKTADAIRQSSV